MARAALLTQGTLTVIDHLAQDSTIASDSAALDVIRAEQSLHARHWQRWVSILHGAASTTAEFRQGLEEQVERSADLFGATPDGDDSDGDLMELHREWRRRVTQLMDDLQIPPVELPDSPAPRRSPDADGELATILAGLRDVRTAHPEWNYEVHP